ncbi:unnamed protein product, partial [Linum tenue]
GLGLRRSGWRTSELPPWLGDRRRRVVLGRETGRRRRKRKGMEERLGVGRCVREVLLVNFRRTTRTKMEIAEACTSSFEMVSTFDSK